MPGHKHQMAGGGGILWNSEGDWVAGGSLLDPHQLNRRAEDFLQEFREAQNLLSVQPTIGSVQSWASWIPPTSLVYKHNFDAVVFAGIKASGFEAVVHNNRGEVMAVVSTRGLPVVDSEEAKVLACRRTVEFVMEDGFRDLTIEGDNVNVMKTIMSSKANYSRLGHIYEDIGCVVLNLQAFSICCVKWSANSVAHSLARYARQIDDEIV
ncbi:hypothetical protein SO802_003164 [Lithocarpus litseifolius]|uniref:RNase H type-1 domain-containing protein n=1 Tax=Lithocarpus litseifolius TaxID=425828 RepID=A0AAW2DZD5_9ROSI